MPLVLATVLLFIVIGLSSRRFDWRQTVLIVVASIALAAVQFQLPRFL
jgi:hypothetical protein